MYPLTLGKTQEPQRNVGTLPKDPLAEVLACVLRRPNIGAPKPIHLSPDPEFLARGRGKR